MQSFRVPQASFTLKSPAEVPAESSGLFLNPMQMGNLREMCQTQVQFVAEISGFRYGAWDLEHPFPMVIITLPLGRKLMGTGSVTPELGL